jgi:RHS repeat-associated protein
MESSEYGLPRSAANAYSTYGWLGGKQRSVNILAGLTLMGVRLYDPSTGRFQSVDPVADGNDNAYIYPDDPVNDSDTDGRCGYRGVPWHKCDTWRVDKTFHDKYGNAIPLRHGSKKSYKQDGIKYGKFGSVHIEEAHVNIFEGGPGQIKWATNRGMQHDVGNALAHGYIVFNPKSASYKRFYVWHAKATCGCKYTVVVVVDLRSVPGRSGMVGVVTAWKQEGWGPPNL